MIEVRNIKKKFGQLEVLRDISLDIVPAAVTSVVGPSGAGKTTLLQVVGTLLTPDAGRVIYDSTDVFTLSDKRLSSFSFISSCLSSHSSKTSPSPPSSPATDVISLKTAHAALSTGSDSLRVPPIAPRSCRAANASAQPWPEPWSTAPRSFSPTNPQAASTPITANSSTASSSSCATSSARLLS